MTSPCNMHRLLTSIHFFKIIPRTSLVDGKLKLPRNFTTKFGDGMSNPMFLKPPDDTEWKIYWTKHDGEMWFQKGWKEFATYYSLDHGHLLFFEYEGTSHFDIHIFDNSALEIDYPSHFTLDNPEQIIDDSVENLDEQCRAGIDNLVQTTDNSVKILHEQCHDGTKNIVQINDDSTEILDEQCGQKTGVKYTVSSPQPCKKMKNSITTNVGPSPNGINLHQHDQIRIASLQESKFMKQKLDEVHTRCPKVEQLTSTALNRATAFKSEHPSFLLVMKPSFINGDYLEIPPQFSEQYLKKTHSVIHLEVMDGRSWSVICSASRITGGWQRFASENNLNAEDVCVFELILKIQSLAFKVSIFRSAGEPNHSKCCMVLPSTNLRGGSSSQGTSQVERHLKLKFSGEGCKEARKFKSENPFFMTTLRFHRNTIRCPRVPSSFVRKYIVEDMEGEIMIKFRNSLWPIKLVFSRHDTSGTLSAGWSMFSRENELQMGDVCIFELVSREDLTFELHVFRGHSEVMH